MKKTILAAVAVTLTLAGCNSKEEAKSVEYYKAHESELQAKYKECDNRAAAEMEKTGDMEAAHAIFEEDQGCKNAYDAMFKGTHGGLAAGIDDTDN